MTFKRSLIPALALVPILIAPFFLEAANDARATCEDAARVEYDRSLYVAQADYYDNLSSIYRNYSQHYRGVEVYNRDTYRDDRDTLRDQERSARDTYNDVKRNLRTEYNDIRRNCRNIQDPVAFQGYSYENDRNYTTDRNGIITRTYNDYTYENPYRNNYYSSSSRRTIEDTYRRFYSSSSRKYVTNEPRCGDGICEGYESAILCPSCAYGTDPARCRCTVACPRDCNDPYADSFQNNYNDTNYRPWSSASSNYNWQDRQATNNRTNSCGNGICETGEGYSCPACIYNNPPCTEKCSAGTCAQDCR